VTTARLFVVEDDRDTLDLLGFWLSPKYTVFSFRCADEALAALETARPHLLLLDIGMRPIDGVACLREIRSRPSFEKIPAIALTGFARACERETFQAAGFQAVLAKPFLDDVLLAAIAAVLETARDQGSAQSAEQTAA
jgi:CheY-like chemotaxis protein